MHSSTSNSDAGNACTGSAGAAGGAMVEARSGSMRQGDESAPAGTPALPVGGSHAAWGIKLLLGGVCVVLLGLELGARHVVPRINGNMRRFQEESAAALSLGRTGRPCDAEILLMGNSLTYSDIDLGLLRERLGATRRVCRWAVDDTNYLDWYYWLRRLARDGARPTLVVVGGRSGHFLPPYFRGRFFAHYILDWRDLREAGLRTGANATAFSNLGLAQLSAFYGCREEIFKRWVTAVLPSFPTLGRRMVFSGPAAEAKPDPAPLINERLGELDALCASYGARLIVWIPPTPKGDANAQLIVETCRRRGIPVIPPLGPGPETSWNAEDFVDGFHMTSAAARRFTARFAGELDGNLRYADREGFRAR